MLTKEDFLNNQFANAAQQSQFGYHFGKYYAYIYRVDTEYI